MTTAVLQIVIAVLKLAFGIAALGVAGAVRPRDERQMSWLLVGVVVTAGGASNLLQSSWAMWAFVAGEGSAAWDSYLRWAPPVLYGRHLTMIALAALLCGVPSLARMPNRRSLLVAGGALGLMAALGWWLGVAEGRLVAARHFSATAALDALEMILFFAALLAGLAFGWMDRWLWTILALYAVRQSFNVISLSAIAWGEFVGAAHIKWIGAGMWALLLVLALHRLRLARRAVPVTGLLEAPGVDEGRAARTLH